ncbi:AraC family transcriptional regulator [Candidatus Enterococcus murrayae]|uniref:AraC family transcriptional regulator n=1 Tax=Candidatus Enterococcus murrayae TaxID=2815321 RepID=A0ABS3HHJ6_9ENTE|nr:AraC family transcriptional regulator [Enterococcus sp. MJM16]MBO0452919.1 AraC family transcriptional regulator [Enterococcus sp. MJM16]
MAKLERAAAVTRMQMYIEENLDKDITLHILAQQAGYSPWHSAKMFKEYTNTSPFEYIRKLRLSRAALVLRDEQLRVIDVALDFVFDSHEGFTRAFRKQFGVTPKSYQKKTPPIPLFTPYPVESYYLMGEERGDLPPLSKNLHVRLIHFPARKLIFLCGEKAESYIEYAREVGCDVWGILASIKEALYEPVGLWLPENIRPAGASAYAQGVEVPIDYQGMIPEGFELLTLPACTMLLFQGDPYDESRFDEAIPAVMHQIDRYDPQENNCQWAENEAPRIQLEPQGYRGYIEARPVHFNL